VIDFGGIYPAALDVLDDTGAAANVATFALTITLPDGTAVTPTVPNPPAATGKYRYPYLTTQAGRHIVRMVTSDPDTAYTDVFDVAEEQPASLFSLADAKRQLGIDPADTSDDDELRMWIAGTTRAVERYKNEAIVRRAVTETEMNHKNHKLRLWTVPVISLDSLARWDGTHTWDVTTDVYTDLNSGLVELVNGPSLRGRITATYTAGLTVIPPHIIDASLVLLQHVWETRRGPGTIGGGVIGPEEAMDYRHMSMLPRKVREWLGEPRPLVA
jgi:hypothetical protein